MDSDPSAWVKNMIYIRDVYIHYVWDKGNDIKNVYFMKFDYTCNEVIHCNIVINHE